MAWGIAPPMDKAIQNIPVPELEKTDFGKTITTVLVGQAVTSDNSIEGISAQLKEIANQMGATGKMLDLVTQLQLSMPSEGSTKPPPELLQFFQSSGLALAPGTPAALRDPNQIGLRMEISKIEQALKAGEAALLSVNSMPYTDNCAVKGDLPQNAVQFAKDHGIQIPNGDGRGLKKDQVDQFKAALSGKPGELNAQKRSVERQVQQNGVLSQQDLGMASLVLLDEMNRLTGESMRLQGDLVKAMNSLQQASSSLETLGKTQPNYPQWIMPGTN